MAVERREHRGPIGRILGRIFPKNGETQPQLDTEATVNLRLQEIQKGLANDSYGSPIAPALAEELEQAIPKVREILGEGDLTIVPTSQIDSTVTTGRRLKGVSIRKALPVNTALAGTNPSVLVHFTSTLQIESIDGIIPGEPKQTISGSSGRNPDNDRRLLQILTDAALASKRIGSYL